MLHFCNGGNLRGGVLLNSPAPVTDLPRRLTAEFLGAALLAMVVVGSGIAAQTLSPRDVGLELLENAVVTGCGLYALIVMLSGVSGAHFNPVISLASAVWRQLSWRDATAYVAAQFAGCCAGAVVANVMFALPTRLSLHHRSTGPHLIGEVVATTGLVLAVFAVQRSGQAHRVPVVVAAYITAAYFFTSSTSFANPAITLGRMLTRSFAGIAPGSVAPFVAAQVVGLALGVVTVGYLYPNRLEPT